MLCLRLFILGLTAAFAAGAGTVNAYFANWARYHKTPYAYTAQNLAPIANDIDVLTYAFAYFCPGPDAQPVYWMDMLGWCKNVTDFGVIPSDGNDMVAGGGYDMVKGLKDTNPSLKTVLSIGGWNFPSAYFSLMASTAANRAAFINSLSEYIDQNGFDGVDIDWEYPCSQQRENPIKMDCEHFNLVADEGSLYCRDPASGFCAECADKANLVSLVTELRAKLGQDKLITIASQASMPHTLGGFDLLKLQKQIDWFNVMTYDYTVSDSEHANVTAANQPIFNTSNPNVRDPWGMAYTLDGYAAAGVLPSKISMGIALYGHTWYVPGLQGDSWKKFGLEATVQNACCGPWYLTYGAAAGSGCQLCGTMMFSEIRAAGCSSFLDEETFSHISYCEEDSADGHTKAGTWISWNDYASLMMMFKWGAFKKLRGVFIFDTSQDTLDTNGTFTYEYTKNISGEVRAWT